MRSLIFVVLFFCYCPSYFSLFLRIPEKPIATADTMIMKMVAITITTDIPLISTLVEYVRMILTIRPIIPARTIPLR